MKKNFIIISMMAVLGLLIAGCSSSKDLPKESKDVSRETHAKFVSVERLSSVPMGSSYEEVVRYFGSSPYEMLSRQLDGYQVFVWKYRVSHREVTASEYNAKGSEASGNEKYVQELKNVYALFKNDRLMDLITDNGKTSSPDLLMITNTIYQITKDVTSFNTDSIRFPSNIGVYMSKAAAAPAAVAAPDNTAAPAAAQPAAQDSKKSKVFSFLKF